MNAKGLSIRHIRYFVAVSREGSFLAAAKLLHISQPALGLQIRDLEARLGVALFERHARGIALTPAGQEFLLHAEEVLDALGRAQQSVTKFANQSDVTLLLGVTPTIGRVFLEDLLGGDRPGPRFDLREALSSDLIRSMRENDLAAAFCYDPPLLPTYHVIPLFEEDLVLVGRPQECSLPSQLSVSDLPHYPLALGPKLDASRQAIERVTSAENVQLDIRAEIAPISLKREMLIRRGLYSIVPYGLFLPEIEAGRLSWSAISPPIKRTMMLVMRSDLANTISLSLAQLAERAVEVRVRQGQLGWRLLKRS